jgi:hypothetical protein
MLNVVALCGWVADAGVTWLYRENRQPEAKWTLVLEEVGKGNQVFRLFVPCVAYTKAEDLAERLDPGDLITLHVCGSRIDGRQRAASRVGHGVAGGPGERCTPRSRLSPV